MAQKTKAELTTQNNNLITTNSNEEITGAVLNGHLKDFIDSFIVDDGTTEGDYVVKSYKFSSVSPTGGNTNIAIPETPVYEVEIYLNGERFYQGETESDAFYFKDGALVRLKGDVIAADQLYYNSTTLGYTIDTSDSIILTFLKQI